tara:strand:+ start:190 stop:672 length:483 start_codon:yes stop_codon:yes gene_type:complete
MTTNYLRPLLWSALLVGLTVTSCKEEDKTDPPPTRTEMLTGNNWTRTRIEIEPAIDIDNNGTQENNLTPYFAACDLDDFMNLKTDKTYIVEEGPSKCDPNDPQIIETGVWTLNSDNTRIALTGGGVTTDVLIKSISSSQWIGEEKFVDQGVTYTLTTTYN